MTPVTIVVPKITPIAINPWTIEPDSPKKALIKRIANKIYIPKATHVNFGGDIASW